jgi:LytR cell envelope-related transcriptional attenuator
MTTPDQTPPDQTPPAPTGRRDAAKPGAWTAVGRLLSLQLLTVIAVTAVITGVYALAGGHHDDEAVAGASTSESPSAPASRSASPPASKPAATSSSPATTSSAPPTTADRLKVDVLNQSAKKGAASKTADLVRQAGWVVGRVADFHGNVSTTTVYYPEGEAKAAHELANELPGTPRVLPRFSTIADKRLTVIVTR